MLPKNSRSSRPKNPDGLGEPSQLMTRRSIVLGLLVALVPITALVVAALGSLLTMLSHSS